MNDRERESEKEPAPAPASPENPRARPGMPFPMERAVPGSREKRGQTREEDS